MMMYTHVAGAFLFGLLARPFFPQGNSILFYAVVIAVSFIPDMDHPTSWINNKLKFTKIIAAFVEHRGIFHSGLFGAALAILTYVLISQTYAWAVLVGFFSHILLDGLTRAGVNLLHPLSQLRIQGPIITNTLQETAVFGVIIVLVVLQLI